MSYGKLCKTCGETIKISNEVRRKDTRRVAGETETEVLEVQDINGNKIYKKNVGSRSLGRVHDKGQYFCSEQCYNKHEVPRQL